MHAAGGTVRVAPCVWMWFVWSALVSKRRPDNPTALRSSGHRAYIGPLVCAIVPAVWVVVLYCMAGCRFGMSTQPFSYGAPDCCHVLWLGSSQKVTDTWIFVPMHSCSSEAKVAPYHHLRDVAHLLLPSAPFPADDGYDPAPPIRFLLALHLA